MTGVMPHRFLQASAKRQVHFISASSSSSSLSHSLSSPSLKTTSVLAVCNSSLSSFSSKYSTARRSFVTSSRPLSSTSASTAPSSLPPNNDWAGFNAFDYPTSDQRSSSGYVRDVTRGVIKVDGLATASPGELVRITCCLDADTHHGLSDEREQIKGDMIGIVLSVHQSHVHCALLSHKDGLAGIGDKVTHHVGEVPSFPVRDGRETFEGEEWSDAQMQAIKDTFALSGATSLKGHIFNPLGQALDPINFQPLLPSSYPTLQALQYAEDQHSADSKLNAREQVYLAEGFYPVMAPAPSMMSRHSPYDAEEANQTATSSKSTPTTASTSPSSSMYQVSHHSTPPFYPTGIIHFDSFHPIAQGTRIGIFGPKGSGKSKLAATLLDSIYKTASSSSATPSPSNETSSNLSTSSDKQSPHLIYCLIGGNVTSIRTLLSTITCLENTTIIYTDERDAMLLQYLTPFVAQALADSYRDHQQHAVVIFHDLTKHAAVIKNINKSFGLPLFPTQWTHAQLIERACSLKHHAGSSTGIYLVETQLADETNPDFDLSSAHVTGMVDTSMHLSVDLLKAGIFPPINIASVAGRPAQKYRALAVRSTTNQIQSEVVQSDRAGNAAKWAHEFGLEIEEDDVPLLRYKIKLQALFNQSNTSASASSNNPNSASPMNIPTYSLLDQYILLQAACVDSLDVITVRNIANFRKLLLSLFKVKLPKDPSAASVKKNKPGHQTLYTINEEAHDLYTQLAQLPIFHDLTLYRSASLTPTINDQLIRIIQAFKFEFMTRFETSGDD